MDASQILRDSILDQIAEGAATVEVDCLVWVDPDVMLITGEGPMSAQRAMWYLDRGDWIEELFTTCTTEGCLRHLSLTPVKDDPDPDIPLVTRHSNTLASLYRQARSRGLVAPTSAYAN